MDKPPSETAIPVRDVLVELSNELEELARVSADVEGDIGSWLGLAIDELDDARRANAIRRLQRLDALTQTLLDFAGLTGELSTCADGAILSEKLAASVKLERVARLAFSKPLSERAEAHGLPGDLTLF